MNRDRSHQAESRDVSRRRIEPGAVGTEQLEDWAVTYPKLHPGLLLGRIGPQHLTPQTLVDLRGLGELIAGSGSAVTIPAAGGGVVASLTIDRQQGFADGWVAPTPGIYALEVWARYIDGERRGGTITATVNGATADTLKVSPTWSSERGTLWIVAHTGDTLDVHITPADGEEHTAEVKVICSLPDPLRSAPAPGAPVLTATAGSGTVALTWVSTDSSVVGYVPYRATAEEGPYTALGAQQTGLSYDDGTVVDGTTYYYRVDAVDAYGNTVASNIDQATPTPPRVEDHVGSSTSGNTLAVDLPVGIQSGERLLIYCGGTRLADATTFNTPSGWTKLADTPNSGAPAALFELAVTSQAQADSLSGSTVTLTMTDTSPSWYVHALAVRVSGVSGAGAVNKKAVSPAELTTTVDGSLTLIFASNHSTNNTSVNPTLNGGALDKIPGGFEESGVNLMVLQYGQRIQDVAGAIDPVTVNDANTTRIYAVELLTA